MTFGDGVGWVEGRHRKRGKEAKVVIRMPDEHRRDEVQEAIIIIVT